MLANKLLSTIAGILIFPIIAFAATKTIESTRGYTQYDFTNESISNGSYLEKSFSYIANQSLDFKIGASSSGTISTANVIWKLNDGTTLASEVLYAGRPIRKPLSGFVTVRIMNNTGGSVTVTGNILFSNQMTGKTKLRSLIGLTIPPSNTLVTITAATQGYWFLRTDQKIYIDFAGGTATSSDFYLNANDTLDTKLFFSAGDTIRMLAASATANVTGYSYE